MAITSATKAITSAYTFQPVAITSATMATTSASHNIKVAIPSATNKTNQNAVTHMAVPIGIIG